MALPLIVPVTCCSPKTCDEYVPVRVSPSCLNRTLGDPVPADVSTVSSHLPATSAALSCAAWAAREVWDPKLTPDTIPATITMRRAKGFMAGIIAATCSWWYTGTTRLHGTSSPCPVVEADPGGFVEHQRSDEP